MKVKALQVGAWGVNCYLVWCPETREALVVDPGQEPEEIARELEKEQLKPLLVVNTHGHLDHIGGNSYISQLYNCPIAIGAGDEEMLTDPKKNYSAQYGQPITSPAATHRLKDCQELTFGQCKLQVIATPGHSPGGICLYGQGILLSGDTLFARSIGRSDLPGGSQSQLIASIKERLMILPGETRVLPGHGPETTIAAEAKDNPWL